MYRTTLLKIAGCFVSCACALLLAGSAAANDYMVIANAENPVSTLTRKGVSKMLLGKTAEWEDGVAVVPFDLPLDNATRVVFSGAVHKKSPERVKAYWLRLVFSGRGTPPDEMDDDGAVVASVAKNRGGLGYVATGTALAGVKAISITD